MAADGSFARVLVKRLNDHKFSVDDRLKIGKRIICQERFSRFKGTELLVIEWIVQQIESNETSSTSEKHVIKLWTILSDVLKAIRSNRYSSVQWQQMSATKFIKILADWLEYSSICIRGKLRLKVIECAKLFVSIPAMMERTLDDIENVIPLLGHVMTLMTQENDLSCLNDLNEVAAGLVGRCSSFHGSLSNDSEVTKLSLRYLLNPFNSLLIKVDRQPEQSESRIFQKIMSLMKKLVFKRFLEDIIIKLDLNYSEETLQRDKANPFVIMMVPPQNSKDPVDDNVFQKPCKALIPFVLENVFTQFKRITNNQKFKLFLTVLRNIGFDFRNNLAGENECFVDNEETWSTLHVLLKSVCQFPALLLPTVSNEVDSSKWFNTLIDALLAGNFRRSQSWYHCLDVLMQDVSLITSRVSLVLRTTLAYVPELDECTLVARRDFLCSLLDVYGRLNQVPALVNKIVRVVSRRGGDYIVDIPTSVLLRYGAMCCKLHPMGTMEVFNHLTQYFLEQMKDGPISAAASDPAQSLHVAADLLQQTLMNAQLIGVAIPKAVLESLVETSKGISHHCVRQLVLHSMKNHALLTKGLQLAHAWGELHLVLLQYQPFYRERWTSLNHSHETLANDVSDMSVLHDYISSEQWLSINAECEKSEEMSAKYAFALLTIQKLKVVLQNGKGNDPEWSECLKSSTSKIVSHLTVGGNGSPYNGDISSIRVNNFSTAIFKLVSDNFLILQHHMSSEDVLIIARIMVSLGDDTMDTGCSVDVEHVSQARVSRKLFQSNHIQESTVFISSIVSNVIGAFADSLPPKKKSNSEIVNNVHRCVDKLSEQSSVWLEFVDSKPDLSGQGLNPMWTCIQEAGSALTTSLATHSESKMKAKYVDRIITEIDRCLDLLAMLPLEYMLMGDQTRCLMAAFAMLNVIMVEAPSDERLALVVDRIQLVIHSLLDGLRSTWLLSFVDRISFMLWIYSTALEISKRRMTDATIATGGKPHQPQYDLFGLLLKLFSRDGFSEIGSLISQIDWQVTPFCENSGVAVTLASTMMRLLLARQEKNMRDKCSQYLGTLVTLVQGWLMSYFESSCTPNSLDESSTSSTTAALLYSFGQVLQFLSPDRWNVGEESRRFAFLVTSKEILPKTVALALHSEKTAALIGTGHLYFISELLNARGELADVISHDTFVDAWLIFIRSVRTDSLSNSERKSFDKLCASCSDSEFSTILDRLLELLLIEFSSSTEKTVVSALSGLSTLLENKCYRTSKIVNDKAAEILTCCRHFLHRLFTPSTEQSLLPVAVQVLQLNRILMNCIKVKAKHASMCLSNCVLVEFVHIRKDDVFLRVFGATFDLLNNFLIKGRQMFLINMVPAFLGAIQQLMHSLVLRGQNHLLKNSPLEYKHGLINMAENIHRMFSQIAKLSDHDFDVFSVYMIADFVSFTPEAILQSDIKTRLEDGIFELMNLLTSTSRNSLIVCLDHTPLEKFKRLIEEYDRYHNYHGKI